MLGERVGDFWLNGQLLLVAVVILYFIFYIFHFTFNESHDKPEIHIVNTGIVAI